MKLFTSTKHKLTFKPLSSCLQHALLLATWAEDEWGYIRNKGVEYREEVLRSMSDNLYVGLLADQPVAMFALLPHEYHPELVKRAMKLPEAAELMYVYVEESFRGLGFGRQIIEHSKCVAKQNDATLIYLDTLKPSLNRLYEKHGANMVCEGRLFSEPTDVFRMNV